MPAAERPRLPAVYGVPAEADGMLPWSWVEQRLRAAPNYWVATAGPAGAPHVRPVDGVWVDDTLCFGGSPETAWVRNLQRDARISVHLPHDDEVVILEGAAEVVTDAGHPLADEQLAAARDKYPQYFGADSTFRPFWALRPATVFAWTLSSFPSDLTRWHFD
jgi:hypothetical protein